jgi:hypothetical protein
MGISDDPRGEAGLSRRVDELEDGFIELQTIVFNRSSEQREDLDRKAASVHERLDDLERVMQLILAQLNDRKPAG